MKNRSLSKYLTAVFLVVFLFSSFLIIREVDALQKYKSNLVINEDEYENKFIYELRKIYNNEEIKGTIKFNDLNIHGATVQTTDNKFYLSHAPDKSPNKIGSIFIDYRNDIKNDKQINIYAHSSGELDLEFNKLFKFLDKDYFKLKHIIEFNTLYYKRKYLVTSVIKLKTNKEHMKIKFNNNDEYKEHLKKLDNISLYSNNLSQQADNKNIIAVQTCLQGEFEGWKLVIIGVEI